MALADDIHEAITDRAVLLERAKAGVLRNVYATLRQLERELIADLAGNGPTEVRTAYQRARLEALLKQTRKTIRANFGKIAVQQRKDLKQVAKTQSEFVLAEINAKVGVDIATVALAPEQLTTIASNAVFGGSGKDWWKRQGDQLHRRFGDAVRQGMLRGETTPQIIKRVRGSRAAGYADGIGLRTTVPKQAETLVRTSVQNVSNQATLTAYGNNQDVIKGVQWTATLDGRTTDICMALHGLEWRYNQAGKLIPVGHDKEFPGPIAHWNCRSTQVPVVKSYRELSQEGAIPTGGRRTNIGSLTNKELRAAGYSKGEIAVAKRGMRASMDGYVARDLTFDSWLKKKGVRFQNQMLGPGRAELWRSGKITLRDLIDQKGRPLTLAELSAMTGTSKADTVRRLATAPAT